MEVFDLSATTLTIPSQSHAFVMVTFTPQAMQLYSAVFEATMEGTSRYNIFRHERVYFVHFYVLIM